MEKIVRRRFLRSLTAGSLGAVAVPEILLTGPAFNGDWKGRASDGSEDFWEEVKTQFRFANKLKYFNNASLGGSALPIRKATNQFRATLDEFPSKYMWGGWKEEKEATRKSVAELFSVSKEEIALIHNTTEGMNLIARSFNLKKGDEVILGDHEHASGTICWKFWQEQNGVKLVRPKLPMLPKGKEEIVEVYRKAITKRTKIISMCHIVNTNGMILPVKEVSALAHELGIKVAVDGAQSAGMIHIDLKDLGCDYYVTSAHKWLFAPKGIGIFYAKNESQSELKPLLVARGHRTKSIRRLENYNTRNLPELLGLGASIDFVNSIDIEKIHKRSYELKTYFRSRLEENSKFLLKSPAADDLSAAIQIVEVLGKGVSKVKDRLLDDYRIDCRPMSTFGLNGLRISLAIYITKADIDFLVNALEEIAG